MAGMPWFKFYPRDWRGDQALRAVSIAARGLWIECLCVMHEAKPYGHLMLNGSAVDEATLARMTGVPVDEVASLVGELQQAGVLSRSRKGVIFSRRMTKDHARAQKGQEAANRRWSQAAEDTAESGLPNGSPPAAPNAQSPETRIQTKDADASLSERRSDASGLVGSGEGKRTRRSYPADFERLWKAYPTDPLMSKKAAYQAWQRLSAETHAAVETSVPAFRAYCTAHPDYRPVHLVRYLQQERHLGFLAGSEPGPGQRSRQVFVARDTPAFAAWQKVKPTPTARSEAGETGWWFPAEWPPEESVSANSLAGFSNDDSATPHPVPTSPPRSRPGSTPHPAPALPSPPSPLIKGEGREQRDQGEGSQRQRDQGEGSQRQRDQGEGESSPSAPPDLRV